MGYWLSSTESFWVIAYDIRSILQSTREPKCGTSYSFCRCLRQLSSSSGAKKFDFTDLTRPHTWFPVALRKKRNVILHVGPTNSGKTYHALKQLEKSSSGLYCGPLRLLAWEDAQRLNKANVPCDLITGQEKEEVEGAKHKSVTVEMADMTSEYSCAVVDEIQMIGCRTRGFSFTRALLGISADELHLCGDPAAVPLIQEMLKVTDDNVRVEHYERLSPLVPAKVPLGSFSGVRTGDCNVTFSRYDIYWIKRRIEGGMKHLCSVVYGSLPPETRTRQVSDKITKFTTTIRAAVKTSSYLFMRKKLLDHKALLTRKRIRPPPPAHIRVSPNHIAHLGGPKDGPKPPQLMSLPSFPGHPLPARKSSSGHVTTAISWLKYYFDDIPSPVIQRHFNKGLVQVECHGLSSSSAKHMRKLQHSDIMEEGCRVYVPVSVAESKVCKRFNVIPSGTLYPNADEIAYLQRLVKYKDSALLVLNKPPKLPVKGNISVHNGMDALAAAALSYDYDEGPKLVHHFDRESSGLLLMGRTKESISYLHRLLSKKSNDGNETICQRYWALVIGSPKQKEGLVCAPLRKVLLDDGETERVILASNSGLESSQEAIIEYRVLGPTINGCSWIELRPHTICKHQLRVHCAEALGTPIVGDYKYGWFFHSKWKQMPRSDFEQTSGEAYKLRRPEGLDVQKGSVLSKVPLLHLHCREIVMPNIERRLEAAAAADDGLLRFVAPMPSHMKISWNLMSSYLV